jgi:hypothetical protein
MDVEISTSDPDKVDPGRVAGWLKSAGYYVNSVSINEGERYWEEGQSNGS